MCQTLPVTPSPSLAFIFLPLAFVSRYDVMTLLFLLPQCIPDSLDRAVRHVWYLDVRVCRVSEHTFEMLIPLLLPMTERGKWHHSKLWASEWRVCVGVGIKMWSYFSSLIYITDSYNEKRPGCHSRQSTKQKRCKAEGKSIRVFVTADRNSCKPNPKIQVMMLIFHFCVITLTTNLMSLKSRHQISSVF